MGKKTLQVITALSAAQSGAFIGIIVQGVVLYPFRRYKKGSTADQIVNRVGDLFVVSGAVAGGIIGYKCIGNLRMA